MKRRIDAVCAAFAATLILGATPLSAWAATPTPIEIVGVIVASKVLPTGYQVMGSCSADGQFTVSTYRNPKAQEKDLKIDAVLMTKVLYDRYSDILKSVVVKFHDPARPAFFRVVTVPEGLIKRFASGELSQQALLDVIAVTQGGGGGATAYAGRASKDEILNYRVVDGYKFEERSQVYLRIRKLAKFDVDMSKPFNELRNIDNRIRRGESEEIIAPYNTLVLAVNKAETDYTMRINQLQSQQQMANAETQSRATLATYRPRFGVGYRRRVAMWSQVQAFAGSGRDVSWYMKAFEDIENSLAGDPEVTKVKIMQLERQLGLPSSNKW